VNSLFPLSSPLDPFPPFDPIRLRFYETLESWKMSLTLFPAVFGAATFWQTLPPPFSFSFSLRPEGFLSNFAGLDGTYASFLLLFPTLLLAGQ